MKEIFKDIERYEGLYQVSNLGNVKSLISNKILKPAKNKNKYLQVGLCKQGKMKTYLVHRLVAKSFISNPNNLPEVNHKDEDKTNNASSNLEFCDAKYNNNYGTRNERISKAKINGKKSKKVLQFTLDRKFIREWPSTAECGRNGFCQSGVAACCRGKLPHYKGFIWKYS